MQDSGTTVNSQARNMAVEDTTTLSTKRRGIILVFVLSLLGLLLYQDVLYEIVTRVIQREDASHGVCVPFISAYILWRRFKKIRNTQLHFDWLPGISIILFGLLAYFLAPEANELFVAGLSFLLLAAGLIWGLFGREIFKQVGFPLFFLAAMIPLPAEIYDQLTQWMRMATTTGSVWLVQSLVLPISRQGYTITLGDTQLFVADSCSGIRYLIPYFVFGLAYAMVRKTTAIGRVLVVLATFPLAIVGGILRLSLIFLAVYYIGPIMASWPHIVISWFVFTVLAVAVIYFDAF